MRLHPWEDAPGQLVEVMSFAYMGIYVIVCTFMLMQAVVNLFLIRIRHSSL